MKKYILLLTILCSIAAWSGNGFSQTPGCDTNTLGIQKPSVSILSTKHHPDLGNGTYFLVGIFTSQNPIPLMNGLARISAQNITNSQIDGHVYEFDLTPTLRNFGGEFDSGEEFKGQYGMYEVTIDRWVIPQPPSLPFLQPITCRADSIDPNLTPLSVPEKLKVSFESGPTTPTLSFDPVSGFPSTQNEWYEIRIYDKDYTRRIYKVAIGMGEWCGYQQCSKTDSMPSVTFPNSRRGGQTYEDLVPGEEYLFRGDLFKQLPGGPPQPNTLQSSNFKSFKIPKK